MHRILLAYSGGARSSAAISWLAEKHRAEIVALALDVGQGGDLEAARDRALALGAIRAHVLDVRDEFAHDFILPALKADVLYVERRSRVHLLSRPLIAKKLVEIAEIEQTATVAHACAGDDRHIAPAVGALSPAMDVLVFDSSLLLPATAISRPPGRADATAKSAGEWPHEPAYVEITFSRGAPTAINGIAMPLLDLVGSLDILAGAHGAGRSDRLETPAALLLHAAHKDLQATAITGEADAFSRTVARQYAGLIEEGSWFTPFRESLAAYVDKIQERVSGVVRLELFRGDYRIVERRPPLPSEPVGAAPAHPLVFTATAKA